MKYFLRTVALVYFVVATGLVLLGLTGILFGGGAPNTTAFQIIGTVGVIWGMAALLLFSARRMRQIEEKATMLQITILLLPAALLVVVVTVIELLPR